MARNIFLVTVISLALCVGYGACDDSMHVLLCADHDTCTLVFSDGRVFKAYAKEIIIPGQWDPMSHCTISGSSLSEDSGRGAIFEIFNKDSQARCFAVRLQ